MKNDPPLPNENNLIFYIEPIKIASLFGQFLSLSQKLFSLKKSDYDDFVIFFFDFSVRANAILKTLADEANKEKNTNKDASKLSKMKADIFNRCAVQIFHLGRTIVMENKQVFNKNSYKLYMFLSAFDPHIQLIPYDGKITKYEFIEGEYQLAYKLEKDNYRTRFITHIDTKHGNIEIIQNTGMITRRIKNNFNNNDKVDKGSILGIIKFGSRVDITIPNTFKLQFKLHDDVLLGQTLAVL